MKKNQVITGLLTIASLMLISARTTRTVSTSVKKSLSLLLPGNPLAAEKKTSDTEAGNPGKKLWLSALEPAADAAIGNIIDPDGSPVCGTTISPKITLQNPGSEPLTSVEVGMILDGKALGNIVTLGNLSLAAGSTSDIISLSPNFTPGPGTHELKVFTRNPNGNADTNDGNDTTSVSFAIIPSVPLTYKESFELGIFPPDNGSDTLNGDPGSLTWQLTYDASSAGSASIYMHNFDYEEVGQRDIYRTPKIDVGTLDSVVVFFSVAYKQYEGTSDSLLVLYSPDCGITWLPTGYAKGGEGLSSSPGTTGEDFIPGASEWRIERVAVKGFCAQGIQSIMIGFQSYNDYGNNIYVDGINISGFSSPQRNIALLSVDQPASALCSTALTPAVSFSNAGLDTFRSLKINYQVDGGAVSTFNWTGILGRCSEASAVLNAYTSSEGTHVLTVFTSEPNGLPDLATANDTLRKTFTIYNTTPLTPPVTEDFETVDFQNWGVQNLDGLKTWERTIATAKTGSGSLWINNPAADNANSAVDNFISPILENPANVDSMFVTFDYAYKSGPRYPGSTVLPLDTLEVMVTKDCGETFTSVWKKWGEELQTVNDPNYSNALPFTPGAEEWRSASIYLTPALGTDNFQVYFSAKSNKQNNIWIDNVNISSKTLPPLLKSQSYLIYPNPFNNAFKVHHTLPPADLKALQVFSSMGQLVLEKRYNGNASTEENINLSRVANGVYILKMLYADKTVVERIVKH